MANQYSSWPDRELRGFRIEKWLLQLSENHELTENRGFDDGIYILWYQNGAEKINKDVKINI